MLTKTAMTVVYEHVAAQCNGGIVVDATGTIGDVSHDHRKRIGKTSRAVAQYIADCEVTRAAPAHRSIISAIVHANICRPSGICNATILALFFLT